MKIYQIKCDCGYCTEKTDGEVRGNGKMILNGVRFVCERGQFTLEDHLHRHPQIECAIKNAPLLLAALEAALPFIPHTAEGTKYVIHPVLSQVRAAIRNSKRLK